jgi:jumonji domain-containing protein 7
VRTVNHHVTILIFPLENDNLRGEYMSLFTDVEREIPWVRVDLREELDAINLWIGNSKSVSALHKDNYENIYCQIVGEKQFVLLPPIAHACVGEQELATASYIRHGTVLRV